MAEDGKTEKPTSKKLQEAYDDGNYAKAPEIGVVFVLIAAFGYLSLQGPEMANQVCQVSKWVLSHLHRIDLNIDSVCDFLLFLLQSCVFFVLPFLLVCCVATIASGGLQTGFRISSNALRWDFGRINIVNGVRMLFSTEKLVNFGISFLKLVVVAWIIWGVICDIQKDPIFYTQVSVQHVVEFIFRTFLAMLSKLILFVGTIAAMSYAYQKFRWTDSLMMSKEEVEDERKNSEGNPLVKGARRKRAYQMAYRQVLTKIPLADVVVTNPTHFAVALKYERGKDSAPVVLAKGKDLLAQKIKEIARQHEVPMVENRPVARALYKTATAGRAIPPDMYQAVAQILAFVYRAHRYYFHRLKARRLEATA
jgi:flagellar biosynthetic protein FlhB